MLPNIHNLFSCSLACVICCSAALILMLGFYSWLACRVSKKAPLVTQPFTLLDILAASILGAWFLFLIVTSFGKDQTITLPLILENGVVYFFLVSGIMAFHALRHLKPIQLFGLNPEHPWKVVKTAFLWLLVSYPLIMVCQGVVQTLFNTGDDAQDVVIYFLNHSGWHERVALIFMAVIVAPIAEEFLFRGYLYGVLRRFAGRLPAIAITSLLFSAVHLHAPSMLGLGLLAVLLCLVYERTGSLWANICIHATFNTVSIVMLLLLGSDSVHG